MAVLQKIFEFFATPLVEPVEIIAAPEMDYEIRLLTEKQLEEVFRLNRRCFREGENYPFATLEFLLSDGRTLSYRAVAPNGELVGFVFVTFTDDASGHITTIGVAPEHRKRGIAEKLIGHIEKSLRKRSINTIFLEVRVSNSAAQNLYRKLGFSIVQSLPKYYSNGEDGFLMVKSLS